jgi:hypothetical protein
MIKGKKIEVVEIKGLPLKSSIFSSWSIVYYTYLKLQLSQLLEYFVIAANIMSSITCSLEHENYICILFQLKVH